MPLAFPQSCVATQLQGLKPSTVLPEQYTARCQALTMLKRIESIDVSESVKRNGHRYYAIDVYFEQSRSHIPTLNKSKAIPTTSRAPDVRIERRLSEILNLRNEMYYFAHAGHGDLPCAFCKHIVHYVVRGRAKPSRLMALIDGQKELYTSLSTFLSDILSLTTTVKAYGHQCQGQENIPTLFMKLLFPNQVFVESDA